MNLVFTRWVYLYVLPLEYWIKQNLVDLNEIKLQSAIDARIQWGKTQPLPTTLKSQIYSEVKINFIFSSPLRLLQSCLSKFLKNTDFEIGIIKCLKDLYKIKSVRRPSAPNVNRSWDWAHIRRGGVFQVGDKLCQINFQFWGTGFPEFNFLSFYWSKVENIQKFI